MVGTGLPQAGDVIDRYRVVAPIATGGMAAVFAAQRTSVGGFHKLLALKVILPHLAADQRFVDMFLDEARIASQVQHGNVVQVFDVVEYQPGDGTRLPCIVMEFLRGRSLSALIRRADECGQPLPRGLRLHAMALAAAGLCAAHQTVGADGEPLGIVHRDVSPQNVHIGYDGQVKVVDFGIAAARGRLSTTRTGELKGKLEYLAPEQITASPTVTASADVWSLGVMAWQLLTGLKLFAEDTDAATMWNVVHRPVRDIVEQLPDLDGDVADAVMGCLERDAGSRIAGHEFAEVMAAAAERSRAGGTTALATAMRALFSEEERTEAEALEQTLSSAIALTPTVEPGKTIPSTRRRPIAPWLAAGTLLIAAAAAAGVIATSDAPAATQEPDAPGAATAAAVAEATPEPDAEPDPLVTRTITVEVGRAARMVLVDGVRHDERPVVVALDGDQPPALEIVTASGDVVTRQLTAAAEHVTIEDSELSSHRPQKRTRRSKRRPSRKKTEQPSESGRKLLGSPYKN